MRYLSIKGRKALLLIQSGLPALFMVALMSGIACASSGGHGEEHGSKLVDFAWRAANFIILAFLLYKYTWGKIKGFFDVRREGIKTQLEEAIAAKEAAEKKFKEYSDRLAKATEEIGQISEMIKSQGRVEKEKIVENAKLSATKMKEDARARMEQDLKSASNHLRAEAAELSVKMAEDILVKTIKETDHDVMVTDFLNRMVTRN
jgi:F-type H+-transporting ATPase subunit b